MLAVVIKILKQSIGPIVFLQKKERPFIVYAVFECSLTKSEEQGILHNHEPNSAAYYVVNTFEFDPNMRWSYVGKASAAKLIIELNKLAQECIKEMKDTNTIWI